MSAQTTETTATSQAPEPAGLVVRFEQKVTVTNEVNLDRLFAALSEHERGEYFKVDLTEVGYTHEFERPLAYLTALAEVDASTLLGSYTGAHEDVIDDYCMEARVTQRDGVPAKFAVREWTRADFEALAATAPWIKPEIPWEDMTEDQRRDLLRAPGPNDVPLAIDWSGLVAL